MFERSPLWESLPFRELLLQVQGLTLLALALVLLGIEVLYRRESAEPMPPGYRIRLVLSAFGILGLGALLTEYFGPTRILLAFGLAASFTVAVRGSVNSTCLFIALYFLRPWEVIEPNELMLEVPRTVALLAIGHQLLDRLRLGKANLRIDRGVLLLGGLALWLFLSTTVSADSEKSMRLFFDQFLKAVVIFLLIVHAIRSQRDLRALSSTLVLSILGVGAQAAVFILANQAAGDPDARLTTVGMFSNANDVAAIMVIAFPFAFRGVLRSANVLLWALSLASLALITTIVVDAESRGALLSLLVVIVLMIAQRMKWTLFGTAALCGALALVITLGISFGRSTDDLHGSTSSRLGYWKASVKMMLHSPALGVGYARFGPEYEHYSDDFEHEWGSRTAHSSWFLVLAEGGIPAFLLLIGLFGHVVGSAWRMRENHPNLFYSVIAYGVAMSFLSHSYTIYPYILFALILGAAALERGKIPLAFLILPVLFLGLPCSSGMTNAAFAAATAEPPVLEATAGADKPLGAFSPPLSQRLELKASRGETVNFLLRVKADAGSRIRIEPSSMRFRLYGMPRIHTQKPSFAGAYVGDIHDPLVPLPAGILRADMLGDPAAGTWLFGEAEVSRDQPPGEYPARIILTSPSGAEAQLPIQLSVWKLSIPSTPSLPAYAEYSSYFGLLGHYGTWVEGQEGELARQYIRQMIAHRIAPLKTWLAHPKLNPGPPPLLDLDQWPKASESYRSLRVDTAPDWALLDFPWKGPRASPSESQDWWQALQNTIAAKGLQRRSIVYLWDEPADFELDRMLRAARSAKNAAPDVKLLVTSRFERGMEDLIDIICPPLRTFERGEIPSPEIYSELHAKHKQVWWYLSCVSHGCDTLTDDHTPDLVIDRPSSSIRAIAWLSALFPIDAFLYYSVNNGYAKMPERDPWNDLYDFGGNGDGTLFYPGRPGLYGMTSHQPVASIRLKLWREASFDADYISMMNALRDPPPWWPNRLHALVQSPRQWSRDYAEYQRLRDQIGDYLSSRPAALPGAGK